MTEKTEHSEKPKVERDEDAPILSAKEIAEIKTEARKKILASRKSAARQSLMESETQRLKNEEGLVTGDSHKDEMVTLTIDLAEFSPAVIINGHPYWHGHTYSVPRHVGDTLREQMFRTWGHQNDIDGKSRSAFYAAKHVAALDKVKAGGKMLTRDAA